MLGLQRTACQVGGAEGGAPLCGPLLLFFEPPLSPHSPEFRFRDFAPGEGKVQSYIQVWGVPVATKGGGGLGYPGVGC